MTEFLSTLDERVLEYQAALERFAQLNRTTEHRRFRERRLWTRYWCAEAGEKRGRILEVHHRAVDMYYRARNRFSELACHYAQEATLRGGYR